MSWNKSSNYNMQGTTIKIIFYCFIVQYFNKSSKSIEESLGPSL